jgi:sulfite exporter TauE/SafE
MGLDGDVLRRFSEILLVVLGVMLLSTAIQTRHGLAAGNLTNAADRLIRMLSVSTGPGQLFVGLLLGLVWSPCVGPTPGAASLLAAQRKDLLSVPSVMLAFGVGTKVPMVLVAMVSRRALLRWRQRALTFGQIGRVAMGAIALAVGVLILSGPIATRQDLCRPPQLGSLARPPKNAVDLHRPLTAAADLTQILTVRDERTVTSNLTVRYDGIMLTLEPTAVSQPLARKRITLVNYPDGRFSLQYRGTDSPFRVFDKIRTWGRR